MPNLQSLTAAAWSLLQNDAVLKILLLDKSRISTIHPPANHSWGAWLRKFLVSLGELPKAADDRCDGSEEVGSDGGGYPILPY